MPHGTIPAMAGENERHDLPTLAAAPLNLSPAQRDEMQVLGYLLRTIGMDAHPDAKGRLETMAWFFEQETEQACRIYKYAHQRALDPARLAQVRAGIVSVTDGELRMVAETMKRKPAGWSPGS